MRAAALKSAIRPTATWALISPACAFPMKTRVGWWKNGYPKYFGKAINAVNFGKVAIFVDDQEVDLAENEVSGFRWPWICKTGVLRRTFTVFGVQFCLTKFFSVAQKELALMRWDVVSADGKSHHVKIESFIDADVKNEDADYEETFWQVLNKKAFAGGAHIAAQTVANPFGVPQFYRECAAKLCRRFHRNRTPAKRLASEQHI